MKKLEDVLQMVFAVILFCLMFFGLYKAIESKEFGLAIGVLSFLFVFLLLVIEVGKIKRFRIGGDKLSVSVNEVDNEPKA